MFSSYHVRTEDVERASRQLAPLVRGQAWLSQPERGWISLYDAYLDRPDPDEMQRMALSASQQLEVPALGLFVSPGSPLVYVLADRGELVDAYASRPDALSLSVEERAQFRGRAHRLMGYVQPGVAQEGLEALLHGGPPPGSGLTAEHVDAMRQQLQGRMPQMTPEMVQGMLQQAAQQLRFVPPAMLEGFLRSMGLPPDHPALVQMKTNPSEFFARLAADESAVKQFADNIVRGFEAGPGEAIVPPQDQAVALAHALGIDPGRVQLSFMAVNGLGAPDGFRLLTR
ncbi:MAG TPA: hypothetical protein VGO93_30135 [Candidatus Xenobia bacterium]|jgi:hypothetical protein